MGLSKESVPGNGLSLDISKYDGREQHVRAYQNQRSVLLHRLSRQDRRLRLRGRGVPHRRRRGQGRRAQGAQGARRARLDAARHTGDALERRPHRRLPVFAAPDRLQGLRPRRRGAVHAHAGAGAELSVRRLSAQGAAAQVPDGSALRLPGRDGRGLPRRRRGAAPARALLRHVGLPPARRHGVHRRLRVRRGDARQVRRALYLRRAGLPGHAGQAAGDRREDVRPLPRGDLRGHSPSGRGQPQAHRTPGRAAAAHLHRAARL